MFKQIVFLLITTYFVLFSDSVNAQKLINVPYKDVVNLPYNDPDFTLSYGDDPLQFVKLWEPIRKSEKAAPLVIFVHGGCWLNAFSIDHSLPMTSALAERGFLVGSIEYRRTGDEGGGWPGSLDDVLSGIHFILKQKSTTYNKNRVFVIGHSAGGHLAALAAAKLSGKVNAIGLAAITDIRQYSQGKNSCQKAVHGFMGGTLKDIPLMYDQATPSSFKYTQLIHGTADSIVPIKQSRQAMTKTVEIDGAGHFDFLHPASQAFSELVDMIKSSQNEK